MQKTFALAKQGCWKGVKGQQSAGRVEEELVLEKKERWKEGF
jgi:hypothetical protein